MRGQQGQRVGLTGGIGSGKSTVARMLVDCGAVLIDADAISRQLTGPGGAAMPLIILQFGPQAVTPDGAMDRDRMRSRAFSDATVRQQLESIIHPLVSQEAARQAELAATQGSACMLFDIPLLVESGHWRQQLDQVLVVDCRQATQIGRVCSRSGWTPEVVEKIIAGQASRAQRRAAADTCLYNDDLPLDALEELVRRLARRFGL